MQYGEFSTYLTLVLVNKLVDRLGQSGFLSLLSTFIDEAAESIATRAKFATTKEKFAVTAKKCVSLKYEKHFTHLLSDEYDEIEVTW